MRVIITGSGASWPDSEKSSPSQVVFVDDEPLLFDCGPGTAMNMMKAKINSSSINRFFLTHLHMDHALEFPSIVFQSYLLGRENKVDLYGPVGSVDYCKLLSERVYPYAPEIVNRIRKKGWRVEAHEATTGIVLETGKFRVVSAQAVHGIPTIAYKIAADERIVVISGDTRPCESVVQLAKRADLLIHECSFPDDMLDFARQTYHSTASEVGEVANQAGVKKLVLSHMFPACRGREGELINSVSSKFGGEVIAGHDLLEIRV